MKSRRAEERVWEKGEERSLHTQVFVSAEIVLFRQQVPFLLQLSTVSFDVFHHRVFPSEFVVIGKVIDHSADERIRIGRNRQCRPLLIVSETRMIVRWIEYRPDSVHRCPTELCSVEWWERRDQQRTSRNSNLHQNWHWSKNVCQSSGSAQFCPYRYSIERVPWLCSHHAVAHGLHHDPRSHGDHLLIQVRNNYELNWNSWTTKNTTHPWSSTAERNLLQFIQSIVSMHRQGIRCYAINLCNLAD